MLHLLLLLLLLIIITFWSGENPWWLKNYKSYKDLFGSAPYSGRSSSIKPSRSETELNRCTTTKIRWKKTKMHEQPWSSLIPVD